MSSPTLALTAASDDRRPSALDAVQVIYRTLAYYQPFRYPLSRDELWRFALGSLTDRDGFESAVDRLLTRDLLGQVDGLIYLDDPSIVDYRRQGERAAEKVAARVERRARLIARFPFVRAVLVSGSLSKGVRHDGDDVDFFAITAPSRLWISRVALMVFKRVALLNSHRFFCINYLVTEDQLSIDDRNVFTAIELAWLRPVVGGLLYRQLVAANRWIEGFLPQWTPTTHTAPESSRGVVSRSAERLLDTLGGEALDSWCRRGVVRRNTHRYGRLGAEVHATEMRTDVSVSTHQPRGLRSQILQRYAATLEDLEQRIQTPLPFPD